MCISLSSFMFSKTAAQIAVKRISFPPSGFDNISASNRTETLRFETKTAKYFFYNISLPCLRDNRQTGRIRLALSWHCVIKQTATRSETRHCPRGYQVICKVYREVKRNLILMKRLRSNKNNKKAVTVNRERRIWDRLTLSLTLWHSDIVYFNDIFSPCLYVVLVSL